MKYRKLKSLVHLCFVALVLASIGSCSDNDIKSFSDLKEEQKDAINRLISEKQLKVVELDDDNLPNKIDSKVYYKFPNGLYMRVLDRGELNTDGSIKRVPLNTKLALAFKGYLFSWNKKEYPSFDNMSNAGSEFTFFTYTYFYNQGDVHFTLVQQENGVGNLDAYMCEGLAYPMTQLGNGASVSLIVPFEVGPQMTYKDGLSLFIDEANYTIIKK